MRGWKTLPVLLVLLLTASTSFAAGFRLPEAGAKAMGMGFAFTAQADDPSAIYFNPAGLTQLKGQNVMVGVTYVRENGGEFTGTTPVDNTTAIKSETQKSLNFFIPNMYYTKTNASTGFAYGVGIFSPFGLGQEYDNKSTSIFRNQITKINLQTIVVNPTIAFKINEFLSVGAGIDWMYGKAKLAKTAVFPGVGNIYDLGLDGDGDAWGYNFGLLLKPSENFRIGANYRSPFTLRIKDGDVEIRNINSTVPFVPPGVTVAQVFGGTSFDTKASTTISLPATFALGVSYTMDKLTVNADADWTFWHSYGSLPIDIKDNKGALLPDTNAQKNWKDVVALRLGAEYRVTDPLSLRAGVVYDQNPVPADTMGPELPDADRMNYMVGAGYKIGPWTIDGAFMYIDKKDRTVTNPQFSGTWTGNAWLAGMDVGYHF
ncbi:OmpP1/FadL family transporter [Candidatus Deferrimicrobium sp.]|uniref:OmpP1/FadL family transporter n=1 Tax=Candidatus Deferrimicrobium sp. TaxID=3060586 RepID=UPI00271BE9CE|nr:OmpP1/FadL family transporter [Candidatus Deferrimicrobium sp.]MDO8738737.1 OmpP1/FadL family transporter [Candidatus Deferrimicrobium sp.]